jgi:hypothetical protein
VMWLKLLWSSTRQHLLLQQFSCKVQHCEGQKKQNKNL